MAAAHAWPEDCARLAGRRPGLPSVQGGTPEGSISRTSAATARIAYSILLDDQVIFDGREGEAVLIGGRWFVTRRTFCDLAARSPVAENTTVC